MLRLIKFLNWTDFGYQTISGAAIQQVTLPSVGTNWHTVKLEFDGTQIAVFGDGVGNSSIKFFRILGLAFGIGVKRNVLNLYKFLCRNYQDGDKI